MAVSSDEYWVSLAQGVIVEWSWLWCLGYCCQYKHHYHHHHHHHHLVRPVDWIVAVVADGIGHTSLAHFHLMAGVGVAEMEYAAGRRVLALHLRA